VSDVLVVRGVEQALRNLRRAERAGRRELADQVRVSSRNIVKGARARVRRRTGRLRRSIRYRRTNFGLTSRIYPTAWYGRLVEFGTKHAPAKPFLFPAFEAEKPAFVKAITERLNRNLF
jgi:HK97 gp10 family phage protein